MSPLPLRLATFCLPILLALSGLVGLMNDLGQAAALPSATFVVTNVNDSGPGSLRQALLEANATMGADVIEITAVGVISLLSPLPVITEALTIQGPGADLLAVDGGGNWRVLDSTAVPITLSDLTIQRGNVSGASANGGGIRSMGSLTLINVAVLSNTAQNHGGGVHVLGDITVTNGLFQNNHTLNGVGGALRSNSITTISGTQFLDNSAQGDGGAIFALGQLTITHTHFQGNQCRAGSCDGGALFVFSETTLNHTQFLSNTAQDQGGGAAAPGVLTITGGLFQNNQAVFGSGGGLFAQHNATVQGSHFLSNTARNNGGGLYSLGAVTVTAALFESNRSFFGPGGGLYVFGAAYVNGTQFLRNVAYNGGGFSQGFTEDGRLINSLFAGNQATNGAAAALLLASTGSVEVVHVTIDSQGVAGGTAIQALAGAVQINNTLITSHTIGISNTGGIITQDYNLFFGNGADTQGPVGGGVHNVTGGDPWFIAPAQDNYHLGAGSAATDSGVDAGIFTDYDGEARPLDNGFDIGFDEANYITGLAIAFTPAPATIVDIPTHFTATVTHGTGINYGWEFGDGAVAAGNPVSHTFTAAGVFPVTVTAVNSAGTVIATTTVPVASLSPPIYLPLVIQQNLDEARKPAINGQTPYRRVSSKEMVRL